MFKTLHKNWAKKEKKVGKFKVFANYPPGKNTANAHLCQSPCKYICTYSVVFVKLPKNPTGRTGGGAIIRLLDEQKSPRKMYTVKFYRDTGKISISESTRSRSFFFENERDQERISIDELEVTTRMQLEYVGFWIQHKYVEGVGATIAVGLNGAPFSADYALVRWTDTNTQTALRRYCIQSQYSGFRFRRPPRAGQNGSL